MFLLDEAVQRQLHLLDADGLEVFCPCVIEKPAVGIGDDVVLVGIDSFDHCVEILHHQRLAAGDDETRQAQFIGLPRKFANVRQINLSSRVLNLEHLFLVAVHVVLGGAVRTLKIAQIALFQPDDRADLAALLHLGDGRQLGGDIRFSGLQTLALLAFGGGKFAVGRYRGHDRYSSSVTSILRDNQ